MRQGSYRGRESFLTEDRALSLGGRVGTGGGFQSRPSVWFLRVGGRVLSHGWRPKAGNGRAGEHLPSGLVWGRSHPPATPQPKS